MDKEFEIPQEILDLHKKMDEQQIPIVKAIGDKIGYGRLMQLAEQIWGEKVGNGGELTIGACASFMVPCKHRVKNDMGHCEICCGAGRVTLGVAKIMNTRPEPIEAEIERAALALYKMNPCYTAVENPKKWEDCPKEQKRYYLKFAKAALMATREV